MNINEIHLSIVNGQGRQAAEQIKEFGPYDFFICEYGRYLSEVYESEKDQLEYFKKATKHFIISNYR